MQLIDYPNTSMVEQIYKAAQKNPEATAYKFQEKSTSYREFIKKIENTAKGFIKIGIGKGDRVTICMPNTPQAVDCFYALNRIGAVPVMIHPLSGAKEIEFFVGSSSSKAIVTLDMFYEKVCNALKDSEEPVKIIVARIKDELPAPIKYIYPLMVKNRCKKPLKSENTLSWKTFMKNAEYSHVLGDEFPKYDDVAVILFSGGTTGTTKGILLTNMNMNALALQTGEAAKFSLEGLRMLSVMPLFHGFGLGIGVHTPLVFGGTCILVPQFTVKTYANLIKREQPNVIPGVPTLFEALLRAENLKDVDMSFLRGVFCGGDSLPPELKRKVDSFLKEHNAKVQIREGYGTTECVTASCLTPHDRYKEGSIGIPYPDMHYKIVKPGTNERVSIGDEGEICISGPTVMKGYMDAPEETALTLREHGDGRIWLHTGDLGTMDEEGYVYFRQRIKRLIIVSGYNVYPSQVENAIDSHPDVLYSCVVGVSDIYKMHKVKAFVVLKQGVKGAERIKEEILHICRERVSQFAVPYEIEFRDELPKTLVGKVAYKQLEEEANKNN